MKTLLAYAAGWFGLLIIAVINGAGRQYVYGPYMSALAANQISCGTGIVLFAAFIWYLTGICRIRSAREALLIGGAWLIATVAFEFLFFHYVSGESWDSLLAAYDIFAGNLWVLVLVWVAVAPWVFFRLRR